ncbi:Methyltransferase [Beijerinckiaceae bacterium RH AL1]|nr:Methyltransferase [Beijerinckiaceae bacterium RH AL8]VVB43650.1 Methyltransferase [Beijerinckiaceae bacterium RH CH11]VVC53935.1 Methyltransferase [Beijerinckiaceae bacterium RH AL1]
MTDNNDQMAEVDSRGSSDRFGYEWAVYSEILPDYEEQFRRWTPRLRPEDWRGKTFLDVGCGMGRNSYWPMRYGAAGGAAVDIDERSLESARRNLAPFPTLAVMRRSAYDLVFDQPFDIAFSIGVIHHIEDPARALAGMVAAVKPGGKVAIWVYGRENNRLLVSILNPLRKSIFSKLPIKLVHLLSNAPTAALWLLLRLGYRPTAYYRLIAGFSFGHLRSIVFDQMLPTIANYWTKAEVAALMSAAGLKDVELDWVNEMSWAAIGTRP